MPRRFIISIILMVAWLCGWRVWLSQREENAAIEILASQEADLALPVYAQFIVTQSLVIEETLEVKKLEIPFYFPENHSGVRVRLTRNGRSIGEWEVVNQQSGIHDVSLPLTAHNLIDGNLEIQFDGSSIAHSQKERAPRVFVEKADDQFPYGNYRVADNEKSGDVALRVLEEHTKWQLFLDTWKQQPLAQAGLVIYWLILTILIAAAPYAAAFFPKVGT